MNASVKGFAMASYFGGRAEVRVRKENVPVDVVDFTSMYPTVFILLGLQELIAAKEIRSRDVTAHTQGLLDSIELWDLYDPALWPLLRRIVRFAPNGATLPVRMRLSAQDPYKITVSPFTSDHERWYTIADVIAGKLLGNILPKIERAIEFYGFGQNDDLRPISLLGATLDPRSQMFKTVIEERQRARSAKAQGNNPELARLDLALKLFANSGSYGIFAEVNVTPGPETRVKASHLTQEGLWYSDVGPRKGDVHNERPGAYFNPIISTLDTGGARLMLAMLEAEVTCAGGTFVFCDTDSLAIVAGADCPGGIKRLSEITVASIIAKFDRLNPYDRNLVKSLLKREYAEVKNLRCFAVSAKRYVLFTLNAKRHITIVKASESGLGAAIGRTRNETVRKLARRIWTAILIKELGIRYPARRTQRMRKLCNFDVPFRRRFPITQTRILKAPGFRAYNATETYDCQIKPFNFLQTVTPATVVGDSVLPIAPFEQDAAKSRKLPWTDFRTGEPITLDWAGTCAAGTTPVMRLDEFVENYARHPESKAGGPDGRPATADTRGLLGRLELKAGEPSRIGKEIDRLDEDDGARLDQVRPTEFGLDEREELEIALKALTSRFSQTALARILGVSDRRLRDIQKCRSWPRKGLRSTILRLAHEL